MKIDVKNYCIFVINNIYNTFLRENEVKIEIPIISKS